MTVGGGGGGAPPRPCGAPSAALRKQPVPGAPEPPCPLRLPSVVDAEEALEREHAHFSVSNMETGSNKDVW